MSEVDAHLAGLDRRSLCSLYASLTDDTAWALCKRARLRAKPAQRKKVTAKRTPKVMGVLPSAKLSDSGLDPHSLNEDRLDALNLDPLGVRPPERSRESFGVEEPPVPEHLCTTPASLPVVTGSPGRAGSGPPATDQIKCEGRMGDSEARHDAVSPGLESVTTAAEPLASGADNMTFSRDLPVVVNDEAAAKSVESSVLPEARQDDSAEQTAAVSALATEGTTSTAATNIITNSDGDGLESADEGARSRTEDLQVLTRAESVDASADDASRPDAQEQRAGRRVVNYRDYLSQRRDQPEIEVVAMRAPENRVRHRSSGPVEPPAAAGRLTENCVRHSSMRGDTAVKVETKKETGDLIVDLLR